MELVSVAIGAQENPPVARHTQPPHGLVGEGRELVRPSSGNRNAPEVELSRDVACEEQVLAVCREREDAGKPPDGEELLEERLRAPLRDGHAGTLVALSH